MPRRRRPVEAHRHEPAVLTGRNPQPPPRPIRVYSIGEIDAIALELRTAYRSLPAFAAATGLRPEEWAALERRDIDRRARKLAVRRTVTGGKTKGSPLEIVELAKTNRSRREVPLSARALAALDAIAPRLDPPRLSRAGPRAAAPGQLPPPRVGPGDRSGRDRPARPDLRHALHVRVERDRRRHRRLRARPDHGHEHPDDRTPLRDTAIRRGRGHRSASRCLRRRAGRGGRSSCTGPTSPTLRISGYVSNSCVSRRRVSTAAM